MFFLLLFGFVFAYIHNDLIVSLSFLSQHKICREEKEKSYTINADNTTHNIILYVYKWYWMGDLGSAGQWNRKKNGSTGQSETDAERMWAEHVVSYVCVFSVAAWQCVSAAVAATDIQKHYTAMTVYFHVSRSTDSGQWPLVSCSHSLPLRYVRATRSFAKLKPNRMKRTKRTNERARARQWAKLWLWLWLWLWCICPPIHISLSMILL